MIQAKNPILSGFYPDPSICRVGEDFYLVNSSFTYFPGVPIWHSRNLADWEQIGNVLDRNSQVPMRNSSHSGGVFAPTIRYYDGVYYMITTNVSGGGNFIVTSERPEGPWSEPYYLGPEAPGIDPSLFFDEDGTCYYVGTRPNPKGVRYNGDWEIWVQKLDLTTMKLFDNSYAIWKGALKEVIWPEGPHLYKKDDYYYLMIAEGGTGPNHAVTVARSRQVFGPYENNPNNPILTHRHLGKDYPIIYVGHADLVDDLQGNWYMVMLASRRCEGYVGLGRETFLAKVVWEDGWPVVNPGIGKLEEMIELPFEKQVPQSRRVQSLLPLSNQKHEVLRLRNSLDTFYSSIDGAVRLTLLPETLKELESPAYLGFRQLEYNYEAELDMEIEFLSVGEEAGFVILQSNEYHMMFRVINKEGQENDGLSLQVIKVTNKQEQLLAETFLDAKLMRGSYTKEKLAIKLIVRGHGQMADFLYLLNGAIVPLASNIDIHEMSTEVAGGFVGNTLGVYATSAGKSSDNYIDIKNFVIRY
jgi:alpha-N-arabinofuranosidase